MNYLSVCSGIEAPSVAWEPLGWSPVAFAEIEPFPSAVLNHRHPKTPNLGDMTKYETWNVGPIGLMVGGTPCQAFSVAGNRKGLADARGNLALIFCEAADKFAPEWVLWENVPGVLSDRSNAFGCFLGRLCGAGAAIEPGRKGWPDAGVVSGPSRTVAWRVQDAQYHRLAQRRRRVFVLAVRGSGNWRCAAALFPVGDGLCWNPPPRGKAGKEIAGSLRAQSQSSHREDSDTFIPVPSQPISHCLNAGGMGRQDYETETLVAHTLRGEGFDAGEDGTGRGTLLVTATLTGNGDAHSGFRDDAGLVAIPFDTTQITSAGNYSRPQLGDPCHPLAAGAHAPAIAFRAAGQDGFTPSSDVTPPVCASEGGGSGPPCIASVGVRRLTPRECARLQGFPDDYLDIEYRGKPAADGPKYKALGNSMAVPVMRWIARRIEFVMQNY